MRTLVVGAGALGSFLGAGLRHAGQEVTFLARPARAARLRQFGLAVVSPNGNFTTDAPCVLAGELGGSYDVILLAVKAYALPSAMEDFAPAIGPATMILPVLNGMAHLQVLGERFGADHVLGGMTPISAVLETDGNVRHVLGNEMVFGELAGGMSERALALAEAWSTAPFGVRASAEMAREMWEKWVYFSSGAGMTCLMRACFGDILAAPGGRETILRAIAECRAVAEAAGYPPRPDSIAYVTRIFTTEGSPGKASMLRDIERGATTEGAQILGGMAREARRLGVATPILDLACVHLGAYEAARARGG